MKKLFIKLVILCMISSMIIVIINAAYTKWDVGDYNGIRKFREVNQNIQISNTGSSHGSRDFYYENIEEYECFNFALESQTLSYDYRIISHYQDNLASDGIMFIPISYFSFYGIEEIQREEFESKNKRYYQILDKEEIIRYDFFVDLTQGIFPVLGIGGPAFLRSMEREWKDAVASRTTNHQEAEKKAKVRYQSHIIDNNYDMEGNRLVNKSEIEALYQLIDLCKEKDIRPVLVTPPYLREYTRYIQEQNPAFYKDFYEKINEIQDNTGVEYYDYALDQRFCNEYELFVDCDHLNQQGAKLFTEIIIQDVMSNMQ